METMSRSVRTVVLTGMALLAGAFMPSCGGGDKSDDKVVDKVDGGGEPTPLAATVTISNLRNGGPVETGVVLGTASAEGLSAVQVSLDGSAWTSATGTAAWQFKLPTGAQTWRDGASHTIQVRATDGTAYSTPISITVRKGTNKDVNGDGYADVLAGAFAWARALGGRTCSTRRAAPG